jgi:NhaA family Na+:H+ antiporter
MIDVLTKPFKVFFKLESASGLILLFAATIALVISNSNFATLYFDTLQKYISLGLGNFVLKLSVIHWINDVLMTVFFFLVSLEIKREIVQGELSNPKQALLPIIGAIGGMVIPAGIYILININSPETLNGWAIPSATDIAFSLGVLSLLGKRVPVSLKIFLTALAIIDDLGAIVIIAFFYSGNVEVYYLLLMLAAIIVLVGLNKFNVRSFIPYLLVGILLWEFTHKSGIHATIAGVLLALLIPHDKNNANNSLLLKLEHSIAPYVGVSLNGISLNSLLNPVPLGILCGLFFGKQIGVFLFAYISVKLNFAQKPNNSNWIALYAVSVLTGIGFTMSLFVGNLAFANSPMYLDGVKIGVLSGSLLSTLLGYFLLIISTKK